MLILLWGLLGLLLVVLLALVVAVSLPVHFKLHAEAGEVNQFRVDTRLFGGLTPPLRLVDTNRPRTTRPVEQKPDPERKPKRKKRKWKLPGGRAAGLRLIGAVPDLIGSELRQIHFDHLVVDGDFGLGDPAQTGRLYGYLTPFVYAVGSPRLTISLRPDFNRLRFSGHAEAAAHLTPVALLWPVVRLIWRVFVVRQ